MNGKNLLSVLDLTPEAARNLLNNALDVKNGRTNGIPREKYWRFFLKNLPCEQE